MIHGLEARVTNLSPIRYAAELTLRLPFFLFVPWDHRVLFCVRILNECYVFLLRRARHESACDDEQEAGGKLSSKIRNLGQHKSRCLRVALERRAPSCW